MKKDEKRSSLAMFYKIYSDQTGIDTGKYLKLGIICIFAILIPKSLPIKQSNIKPVSSGFKKGVVFKYWLQFQTRVHKDVTARVKG